MAAPDSITLNLLVDKENNRVIFAEAEKDFVDVLCSFLTLPVGTVVRLLSKQSEKSWAIGCMNNLYKSVENLDGVYFKNEISKKMLLHTRNSSANECRKLKVNIDDTQVVKYYVCGGATTHVSTFCQSQCYCGSTKIYEVQPDSTIDKLLSKDNDVFLQGEASYFVTDDMRIVPMSAAATYDLFNAIGVQAVESLESKSVTIKSDEVSLLLKNTIYSNSTLTDTFLKEPKDSFHHLVSTLKCSIYSSLEAKPSDVKEISLVIMCQKSSQIPIYAEAGGDFVNFLFSMLTFPLGAVVKFINQAPALGSITNLYKNVEKLNDIKHLKSADHMAVLVTPKLAIQYGYDDQLLDIKEVEHPPWFYNSSCFESLESLTTEKLYTTKNTNILQFSVTTDLVQLAKFVKREKKFMIKDDLVVTPYSSIATIKLHEQLKIPIYDIEIRDVSIGPREALQILESSMTSNSILMSILKCASAKKVKQEKC